MLAKSLALALHPFASLLNFAVASNEGVYLVNCDEFEPGKLHSEMDYYNNAKSGSQDQQKPDASTTVDGSGYIQWEGSQRCGYFSSSGETFCSNIAGNGYSLATGAFAGTGHNEQTQFNCYKDNGRQLYSSVGITCKSVYYCFDT